MRIWMLAGLVLALGIGVGGSARADDILRYRMPDGTVGFTLDPGSIPPGATLIRDSSSASTGRGRIQIVETPAKDREQDDARASSSRPSASSRPRNSKSEAPARAQDRWDNMVEDVVQKRDAVESLEKERSHACRKYASGSNSSGRTTYSKADPAGCSRARAKLRDARGALETSRDEASEEVDLDAELPSRRDEYQITELRKQKAQACRRSPRYAENEEGVMEKALLDPWACESATQDLQDALER